MYNPYQQTPFQTSADPSTNKNVYNVNQHSGPSQQPQNGQGLPNFFQDPTTAMGLQFGQSAFDASQQYVSSNFGNYLSKMGDLQYLFQISNKYVLKKLTLILFPFSNRIWSRQVVVQENVNLESYAPPVDDKNSPDLYIPVMGVATYILTWAIFAGFKGEFHPQLFGYTATQTMAYYLLDTILLRFFIYILSVPNSKLWDLVAYSGYKFVTIQAVLSLKELLGKGWMYQCCFAYLMFALGFFLMRSLKYLFLNNAEYASGSVKSKMRTQFLFVYSYPVQLVLLWLMT